jgi:enoyl-CoA hydratase
MATDYSDYEFLKIEVAERVATITINRPDSLNAANDVVHHELERVWIDVRADRDINAIICAVRKAWSKDEPAPKL